MISLMEKTVFIFNGRIKAPRCQAKSKRTKVQCGLAAARGKRVCRFHGAKSTGPRTIEGKNGVFKLEQLMVKILGRREWPIEPRCES